MADDFHDEMVDKKDAKLVDKGYAESDFTREYWLGTTASLTSKGFKPRVVKDQGSVVKYFKDLQKCCNRPDASVLDIGAGAGATVNGLRQAGIEAYGCEFSKSGRDIAKEQFGIVLKDCDLRAKLPYEDDSVDFGCCLGVLSMVPEEFMSNAVSEISRVVRYGFLVNIGTHFCTLKPVDVVTYNRHHLTNLPLARYWEIFAQCGVIDISSFLSPQKNSYGIGREVEFCGLFTKRPITEVVKQSKEENGDG